MTKEELAKKKGIKENKEFQQTAAESILTEKQESKDEKPVSKTGRPKGKPSTKISLNVPNEYLDLVEIAAGVNYKGNTSSYIVDLIKKDIDENGEIYEKIKDMQKTIMAGFKKNVTV
jgi:hypothetical protein